MSGPALDFDPRAAGRLGTGDTREAPGVAETLAAGFGAARADTAGYVEQAQVDAYKPVIDALLELNPERSFTAYVNPRSGTVSPEAVWRDVERYRRERGMFTDLPDTIEAFESQWREAERGRIADLEDVQSRGNAAVGFVGAMGGAMTDPINLMSLPFGGFGRGVGGKILSEGLVNAGIEAALLPTVQRNRRELGREDLTLGQAAFGVAAAGFGAAALRGAIDVGPDALRAIDAKGMEFAKPIREAIDGKLADRDLARAFSNMVPENLRTPEQEAALHILTREVEIDDANPFARTYGAIDAHRAKLHQASEALANGRIASDAEIARAGLQMPDQPEGAANFDDVKAAIRGPESGGDDGAVNGLGSSASGRYQFVKGTFEQLYMREYGVGEEAAQAAWQANRFDVDVQERLMDRLLEENASALESAGIRATTGNLYVAHFAGAETAVKLIQAPKDRPVSDFFSKAAIEQNPTYLGGGRTVGDALNEIRSRVGDAADDDLPASQASELAVRPDALDAERPAVAVGDRTVPVSAFRADDIGVDAELMQFKAGGDEFGVTDRLQGVDEWDPIAAGMVTVWESADGRRLIADGHQRLGLARRIQQAKGEPISLNAFVLRESDGFSAIDARIITALKNIGEGTGTATDAAKVFRDVGLDAEDVLRRLPPRSTLVRDGKSLARLDDEAFGAVVNQVIPENYGAAIGALVDDAGLHMAMVRILAEAEPPNRVQAEAIIRQAKEAGFTRETQDSLFGSEELVTGLFAQRAKLLDRALKELRKMRGAFQVAARNADTLEAGGNRIDVEGSTNAAEGNARALALVDKLALRKGNAVNEALDTAARRLADGEPIGRVLKDFVAKIRELDIDALSREVGSAGDSGDVAGRGGRASERQEQVAFDSEQLTPREADAARVAGAVEPNIFDETIVARFDEPDGDGVKAAAESAWHDIRLADQVDAQQPAGQRLAQWIDEDLDRARAEYEAIDNDDLGLTTEGGRVINTDLARELSPEYRADRSLSADVHEAASAFVKRLYATKLREPVPDDLDQQVLFTAGGTGAGKSTGMRVLGKQDAGIIYDTNMNKLDSAVAKIEQALDAGWAVKILYTYRDPLEALVNGALPRAERMGRTVPLAEHVKTHVGARETMDALAERYADDPRVVLQVIDNSRGKGEAIEADLENIPAIAKEDLYDKADEAIRSAYAQGSISRQTLQGFVGRGTEDVSADPRTARQALDAGSSADTEPGDSGPLDRGAETDPDIADRQRQLTQLRADAPMRGANRTGQQQDGVMGSPLFDAVDQPTFDLDDGRGARSAAEIDAEIRADRAAIEEMRKCLK